MKKLLLLDDHATEARELASQLRARGWDVTIVASARAAFDAIPEVQPDAIITELALPDAQGLHVVRALRATGESPDLRQPRSTRGPPRTGTHARAPTHGHPRTGTHARAPTARAPTHAHQRRGYPRTGTHARAPTHGHHARAPRTHQRRGHPRTRTNHAGTKPASTNRAGHQPARAATYQPRGHERLRLARMGTRFERLSGNRTKRNKRRDHVDFP